MSKVEEFIQQNTKRCSDGVRPFEEWLIPDKAKRAVEIAREETIKEVCEWIENNAYSYTWCDFLQHERGMETGKLIEDLKNHLDRN